MVNKEIKKGDKIWIFCAYLDRNSYYVVKSVKKSGTLVSIVVEASHYDKIYEIKMYGHASSSLLSGYDRKFGRQDTYYTCEYSLIEDETKMRERDEKYRSAGIALLNIAKYFK